MLTDETGLEFGSSQTLPRQVQVLQAIAASLDEVEDESIAHICAWTRPYYDNVMYAEFADFFYVWEKQTFKAAGFRLLR